MNSVLYLTRNGLLEPLGYSQVFSYLRGLTVDYRVILVTHEKPEDWSCQDRMSAMRLECERFGIDWRPQPFRVGPKIVAPVLNIIGMLVTTLRLKRQGFVDLVHARSYIPAAVGWLVWKLTDTPFIFDMRALWPEELITAGRIKRGAATHQALVAIERVCLRDSAFVVSLTGAAVDYLVKTYPMELDRSRVHVIPTCADLDRFVPPAPSEKTHRVHGCIGTVLSGWFKLDWLATWISVVATCDPQARFEIVTRDDAASVRNQIDPDGEIGERLEVSPRLPVDMPRTVQTHALSVMFFNEGLGKLGSSPTRMAEVLGTGLPVVANAGVGDVAQIITKYRVGVLVRDGTRDSMLDAFSKLNELMRESDLSTRCRQAAIDIFSLERGTQAYKTIYKKILSNNSEC